MRNRIAELEAKAYFEEGLTEEEEKELERLIKQINCSTEVQRV